MNAKAGEVVVHITEDTDQWNRIALALSRDERRPVPELTVTHGARSALLEAYDSGTKAYIELEKNNTVSGK